MADLALLVVGSVIGSGIFRTPAVVAKSIGAPEPILAAWVLGGVVALCGAFVLGELGARRPDGCGAYAYLRDAFGPAVAFAYGWTALLASLSGGLAAAAVLFAGYFLSLTGLALAPAVIAVAALAALAFVNALGVRTGSSLQNALSLLKLAALAVLVIAAFSHSAAPLEAGKSGAPALQSAAALSLAMIPVLFTYNGAIVANFMAPESKNAGRNLPRGLWLGIAAVAVLYVLVNAGCLRALGVDALARSAVPVSAVLQTTVGSIGARLASLAVAVATLGFMSNRMLTVPRLYHAMAHDGLFFRAVGKIDPRTRVPVVAIVLQAIVAVAIALSGGYEHILNYVVATSYAFSGLLALALFTLRARDRRTGTLEAAGFRAFWRPLSTIVFMIASWGVAITACISYPRDGLAGLVILATAIPAYAIWARRRVRA
ncbi:MAG TPA: amino acid permease [Candidatus Cybelea sp.]|nr:amino acid permease [Candidatus Cybelea sp.]